MKRLLLAIALLLGLADVAAAQNVTCATRPVTDNSNACANTAFVNSYVNNPASPIYSTAHTWTATQTFSASNPSGVCPLSSFYAPGIDPGNKGIACAQAVWDSGNGGLNGSAIVANTVVESTAGGVGAPGAIIAGTLVKADIANLDPYGILGLINNDTAVTAPLGTALWGIVRGAKATGGMVDGLRVASEVANGQRPRFGVAVYNTETDNAFDYGVIAASANLYGVVAGNPSGTSVNDRFPTFPMAVYAKSLGTTWHDGLLLYNATAATAGAQQMSPSIRWGGNGWKTNATAGSQFVDFRADLLPVQGTAAPSSYLRFASSVNNGAYTPNVYFTSGNGVGVGAIPNVAANNGDLTVYRGANSGAIYFGDDGTKYIFQDGTNWQFNGAGLNVGSGGTGLTSFTLGDMIYASAGTTLSKLAGNTTTTRKFLRQTGDGTNSAAPAWDTITAADVPGSALTKTDDTNVTLTLGGSPTTALLNAASITVGWSGTLAASRGGTGLSSLGTGVATWLGTPSSANLAAALTDETGTGVAVFATSPTFTTDIRPASNGGTNIGNSSSLYFGTVFANTHTADGTSSRTWGQAAAASGAGASLTITGGNGAAGTDIAGGNLILSGGSGTGSAGSSVLFYAANSTGGSGTGTNSPAEMVRITNIASFGSICFRGSSCSSTNYAFLGGSALGASIFNAQNQLTFRVSNNDRMNMYNTYFEIGASAAANVHLASAGFAPSLSSCGTSPAIVGTDTAGEVTMGTGSPTGCTITFNLAYTSAPFCTITWQGNPLATQNYTVSTTAITLAQTATSSNKVNYTCIARSGG